MTKDKIINRIRKLLALAKKNSSIEEAAAAMAKAQALMEEHRIHQAMLNNTESKIQKAELADSGHPQQWKAFLASILSSSNGCCMVQSEIYEKDNKILIIGEPKDVESVQELYAYITTELQKLCVLKLLSINEARGSFPKNDYAKSFYVGALHIVKDRLQEAKDYVREEIKGTVDTDKLNVALAKIDSKTDISKIWASKNLDITIENMTIKNDDKQGYEAGLAAGKKINISSNKKLT